MNNFSKDLPVFELGNPGPLRDKVVQAALEVKKTATTSLLSEWDDNNEKLPKAGESRLMIDSSGEPVAIVEILQVDIRELGEMDYDTVKAEGEDFKDVAQWRKSHEQFWLGNRYVQASEDCH